MNKSSSGFDFRLFTWVAVTAAALVFFFLISISLLLPGLSPYLAILLTGIVFLGFPHGALDIFLLRSFRYRDVTPLGALSIYVLAVFLMIGAWLVFPKMSFVLFILYSCFHFSQSDIDWKTNEKNFKSLDFFARFLIPFFIPFGIQSDRSLALAKMINPAIELQAYTGLFFGLAVLGIALSVVIIFRGVYRRIALKKEWETQSLEPFVISALFVFMDPLYALGIYFCFIHSVKHIVNFLNSPVNINFPALIPFWLIPIFAVIGFCYYYDPASIKIEDSLFKWSIIILSSVALPHTLLIHLSKMTGQVR